MKASIDWNIGLIRAGKLHKEYGDPFDFIVTVMKQDRKAFLCGASGVFDKQTYAAVKKVLDTLDLDEVSWEKKNIKPRQINKKTGSKNEKTN